MPRASGAKHHAWKGDDVGVVGVHGWLRRNYPKTGRCEYCGGTDQPTEYASVGHRYTRNRADWFEFCRNCHLNFDGRSPSEETRAKIRAKLKGRPLSRSQRERMSAARKGKRHTPEHAAKIAAALRTTHCLRGHKRTDENTYVRPDGTRECRICKELRRAFVTNKPQEA